MQIVEPAPNAWSGGVTVTPDGNFVDFVRFQVGDTGPVLWRVPFLGGQPRRLIDRVWSPVGWSPDGRHLRVHSQRRRVFHDIAGGCRARRRP